KIHSSTGIATRPADSVGGHTGIDPDGHFLDGIFFLRVFVECLYIQVVIVALSDTMIPDTPITHKQPLTKNPD
ncbi:hypothetical protein ACJX0J_023478, partial [Zea mays]